MFLVSIIDWPYRQEFRLKHWYANNSSHVYRGCMHILCMSWPTPIVTPHLIGWDKQYETMKQKTKPKKRTNQTIVLRIQSDKMLRSIWYFIIHRNSIFFYSKKRFAQVRLLIKMYFFFQSPFLIGWRLIHDTGCYIISCVDFVILFLLYFSCNPFHCQIY
jgi:hypothetical protein